VTTILTSNPGKAGFQNSAVQIAVNDLFDVGAKEPVLPFESVVIDQFECLEMVLHALVNEDYGTQRGGSDAASSGKSRTFKNGLS